MTEGHDEPATLDSGKVAFRIDGQWIDWGW
jgi:hypothetical protein